MYCLMLLLFWFHFYKAWFTREVHQRHVLWHALVSRIRHTRIRWWNPSYCILTESWEFNCTIYGWLYSNTNELKFNGNATERCAHILKLRVVLSVGHHIKTFGQKFKFSKIESNRCSWRHVIYFNLYMTCSTKQIGLSGVEEITTSSPGKRMHIQ